VSRVYTQTDQREHERGKGKQQKAQRIEYRLQTSRGRLEPIMYSKQRAEGMAERSETREKRLGCGENIAPRTSQKAYIRETHKDWRTHTHMRTRSHTLTHTHTHTHTHTR
jgi:hypothetical protein